MSERLQTSLISRESNLNKRHINTLLESGVSPIRVCLGNENDFIRSPDSESHPMSNELNFFLENVELGKNLKTMNVGNVDWHNGEYSVKSEAVEAVSGGKMSYVFSDIDSFDKVSTNFTSCFGLVVAGIDKKTKKPISFVTHQPPTYFSNDSFLQIFSQKLKEMRERCDLSSIDAVVIGGINIGSYKTAMNTLGLEVKKVLSFEPVCVNGPKLNFGLTDKLYFDNKNRRLYLVRSAVNKQARDSYPMSIK